MAAVSCSFACIASSTKIKRLSVDLKVIVPVQVLRLCSACNNRPAGSVLSTCTFACTGGAPCLCICFLASSKTMASFNKKHPWPAYAFDRAGLMQWHNLISNWQRWHWCQVCQVTGAGPGARAGNLPWKNWKHPAFFREMYERQRKTFSANTGSSG